MAKTGNGIILTLKWYGHIPVDDFRLQNYVRRSFLGRDIIIFYWVILILESTFNCKNKKLTWHVSVLHPLQIIKKIEDEFRSTTGKTTKKYWYLWKNRMVFTPNISSHLSHSSMIDLPIHSVGGLLVVFQLSIHHICCSSNFHTFIYLPWQGISKAFHNFHIHFWILSMMHQLLMIINDLKLFGGFADRQTNEQTFGVVESLSRLKTFCFLSNTQFLSF